GFAVRGARPAARSARRAQAPVRRGGRRPGSAHDRRRDASAADDRRTPPTGRLRRHGRLGLRHGQIRRCSDRDRAAVLGIINAAAEAYRGVIPADRWHEPYMPSTELECEIAAGVAYWGYEADDALVGVMGVQAVRDVDLI